MAAANGKLSAWALCIVIGYLAVSVLTLPFINALWLGELPLLAIPQLPKVLPAEFLTVRILMPCMRAAGWSKGSFSPDYIAAKPYGLILVYTIPVLIIVANAVINRKRLRTRSGLLIAAAAILVCLDYVFTIMFSAQPGLTIY